MTNKLTAFWLTAFSGPSFSSGGGGLVEYLITEDFPGGREGGVTLSSPDTFTNSSDIVLKPSLTQTGVAQTHDSNSKKD